MGSAPFALPFDFPPDHRLNARPCGPEECLLFAAKDPLAPTAWDNAHYRAECVAMQSARHLSGDLPVARRNCVAKFCEDE